jgi:hypothetical protein
MIEEENRDLFVGFRTIVNRTMDALGRHAQSTWPAATVTRSGATPSRYSISKAVPLRMTEAR